MKTIPPIVLPPLSALYGAITRTRIALYEHGTLSCKALDRPVISVGNITTGGTGKTPLVEWIARVLAAEGKRVCILSRGYLREDPKRRVVVSDGQTVFATPEESGDEAYLLATKLKGIAAVISDSNRVAAGEGAIKHLHSDCFVLDDGFQHLQLCRNLDIVTIDATEPFGGRMLLPYGRLREPMSGLRRADCILITRADQVESTKSLHAELKRLSDDRPIFVSQLQTVGLKWLKTEGDLSSRKCAAFCGIGNPQSFFNHLRRDGYEIVFEKSFRDHHAYSQSDVDALTASAKRAGAHFVITTEKDAVKLTKLHFELPCCILETALSIENGDALKQLVVAVSNSQTDLRGLKR